MRYGTIDGRCEASRSQRSTEWPRVSSTVKEFGPDMDSPRNPQVPTFDLWLATIFNHELSKPAWYWDSGFDDCWGRLGMTDGLTVEYMTRLFRDPRALEHYSDKQVAQAIWFLIGESSPGRSAYALLNRDVEIHARVRCVESMKNFFGTFVTQKALGAADTKHNDLHISLYMWWDIFPTYGGPNTGDSELHDACLKVMSEILSVPNELCQLSGLHGLNHWHVHHRNRVEQIVDSFLKDTTKLTPLVIQ